MEVEEEMSSSSSSTVQPEHYLATDSFSYSWLVNPPPPTSAKPTTWATTHNSFDFDISVPDNNNCSSSTYSDYSSPLAHADDLFSNGVILPATTTVLPAPQSPLSTTSERTTTTVDTAVSYSINPSTFLVPSSSPSPVTKFHHHQQQQQQQQLSVFPRKFRRVSMKTVYRYLGCLLPIGFRGKRRTRVDDFDRREREMKSMTSSTNSPCLMSSPRTSTASSSEYFSTTTWSRSSSDEYYQSDENSIKEAILYCKRSGTGA